eukprot:185398_1
MQTLLLCWLIRTAIISSYYLSPNTLTWDNAELFCQNHCQSNLASIHSIEDQNEAIQLIMNDEITTSAPDIEKNAWIGLTITIESLTGTTTYQWSDGTKYNYQNVLSHNNIIGTTHGRLFCTQNVTTCPWDNINGMDPNNEHIFLCNDCKWDILSKYAIITENKGNTGGTGQAAQRCENNFGTMIGSIHNDADNNEAKYLCELINDGRACHIGLFDHNNFATEGVYVWSDQTTFDYGSNISGGVYPWLDNEPTGGGTSDCVSLDDSQNYLWRDSNCGQTINTICNKPSEICYKDKWIVQNGNWSWQQCDVINFNENSIDYITLNISNNEWRYMVFDYMFAISWNSQNINEKQTGVVVNVISFDSSETFSYFIGLSLNSDNSIIKMFLKKEEQAIYIYSSNILFYNISNYYSLRVEFDTNGMFIVKINDNFGHYVTVLSVNVVSSELPLNYYIKSLSIKNINVSTISKSLFINGKYEYIFTEPPTNDPTKSPTEYPTYPTNVPSINPSNNPTQSPTKYPTINPSNSPTKYPTNIPTITPTISPTYVPTKSPTQVGRVDDITTTIYLNGSDDAATNDNNSGSNIGIIIGLSAGGLLIAIIGICFCVKRYKSGSSNDEKTEQMEMYDVNSRSNIIEGDLLNNDTIDPKLMKLSSNSMNDNDIIDNGVVTPRDLDDLIDKHDTELDNIKTKGEEKDDHALDDIIANGDDIVTKGEYESEGTDENLENDEFIIDDQNNNDVILVTNTKNDFESHLADHGVGNDIMMDDIVNEIETQQ